MSHAQEPKKDEIVDNRRDCKDTNEQHGEVTASSSSSDEELMRARIHRSTEKNSEKKSSSKGKSKNGPKGKGKDGSKIRNKSSAKVSVNVRNLRTFVDERLNKYKTRDDKFNGLIRILADPEFLQLCYLSIKSKPGNMTKGLTNETLDGISLEWFIKTAESLKTGRYSFSPVRRKLIPKANGKTRPLGISPPREKIVQKGLQAILEAIYEPLFFDCSHGFRPNKSIHSALEPLYKMGHHHT